MVCIIRDYRHCPADAQGAVIAIGNFDGLHLGHQAVIQTMMEEAKAKGAPPAIMSFYPHPRHLFTPDAPPIRLQRLHQKTQLLAQWGVEYLYLIHFTHGFSRLSAWDFTELILHQHLKAKHVITGHDFYYGHQRSGSPETLKSDTQKLGIGCTILDAVEVDDIRCSSSEIRTMLTRGQLDAAESLLGRMFSIEGRVRHGDKRGRTIGIPTANISLHRLSLPTFGAYIAEAWVDGSPHPAVANIGTRPTVEGAMPLLEVHLLDGNHHLYGKRIEVTFHRHLRPEMAFDGLNALKTQIDKDIQRAREYFDQMHGAHLPQTIHQPSR
jgi:riboflavin kinase/FMN adenylyltransferase